MPNSRLAHALAGTLLGGLALTGCATLEPEPCTPEWVDYKTDQILDPFVRKHRSEFRTLRDLSGQLEDPGVYTTLRLASQAGAIVEMAEDFTQSAVPEIQAAVAQCARPRQASELLVALLRREGVEGDVIAWVEALGILLDSAGTET